jgi:hypothetical protein
MASIHLLQRWSILSLLAVVGAVLEMVLAAAVLVDFLLPLDML